MKNFAIISSALLSIVAMNASLASANTYCAAACADSTGRADMRYVAGATANFQAEANQNAITATQQKYSCNFQVVTLGCQEEKSWGFASAAACTDSTGKADLRYISVGNGNSKLESQIWARQTVQSAYSCNFGISDVSTTEGKNDAYCSAACIDSTGAADVRYSKGDKGWNKTDAMVNALTDAQKTFSCNFGVMITNCSQK